MIFGEKHLNKNIDHIIDILLDFNRDNKDKEVYFKELFDYKSKIDIEILCNIFIEKNKHNLHWMFKFISLIDTNASQSQFLRFFMQEDQYIRKQAFANFKNLSNSRKDDIILKALNSQIEEYVIFALKNEYLKLMDNNLVLPMLKKIALFSSPSSKYFHFLIKHLSVFEVLKILEISEIIMEKTEDIKLQKNILKNCFKNPIAALPFLEKYILHTNKEIREIVYSIILNIRNPKYDSYFLKIFISEKEPILKIFIINKIRFIKRKKLFYFFMKTFLNTDNPSIKIAIIAMFKKVKSNDMLKWLIKHSDNLIILDIISTYHNFNVFQIIKNKFQRSSFLKEKLFILTSIVNINTTESNDFLMSEILKETNPLSTAALTGFIQNLTYKNIHLIKKVLQLDINTHLLTIELAIFPLYNLNPTYKLDQEFISILLNIFKKIKKVDSNNIRLKSMILLILQKFNRNNYNILISSITELERKKLCQMFV
ncbi:MAG: hypothetical protein GY830_08660 [Bacteroidetes bacterium]|nr:hypothetical protein [Bacteroidota bacterium]